MNPSTTKKNKKNSNDIKLSKSQLSKQSEIDEQEFQGKHLSYLSKDSQINQNKIEKNLELQQINQNNSKIKTEKKNKGFSSQTQLYLFKDETLKNYNNTNQQQKKLKLDCNNKLNISKESSKKIVEKNKKYLSGKANSQIYKDILIKSKTVEENKNKEKDEEIEDIIIPDNELDETKQKQDININNTIFPNLSMNPFIKNKTKQSIKLNYDSSKKISELKKNLKKSPTSSKDSSNFSIKENIEFFHYKYPTLNCINSKSPTTNPYSSNLSSNNPSINANTEFSGNSNTENLYIKFLTAARRGDKENFLEIYNKIPNDIKNKDYQDENGNTALHYACEEGNLKIVEILLGFKCNPNIKNSANNTPLHLSAKNGYFDISKKLLEFGAELNSENSEKNSPLHYVCENNYIELLKYFLTKNPKVNEKNIYGKTPKDLTTNSEIKNLLDVYIRENDKKINNNDTCEKLENKYSKDDINISKVKNKKNKKKREYIVHPKNIIRLESDNHINDIININGKENKRSQSRENKVNKKCVLKKESRIKTESCLNVLENESSNENNLTNIYKEKKDSKIYFQNTNNINNNNININIYPIEVVNKTIKKNNYIPNQDKINDQGYNYIEESNINGNTNININKNAMNYNSNIVNKVNSDIGAIAKARRGFTLKSEYGKINTNSIFDSIDSNKNNINLNKTEENIFSGKKTSKNVRISNKNLNSSVNVYYTNPNSKKNNVLLNNSKLVQSTEQILTKVKPPTKKKESKITHAKNIHDCKNHNSKTAIKNITFSQLEVINHSNIILSHTKNKLLDKTSTSIEHVSPSDFLCLAQLGKGSFGEVYLVQKIDTKEKYAMKVLRKDRIISQNLLKYAMAERNVLSSSNHPFIVKLNYAFQTSTRLFLVIEYCPYGDLSKHLLFEKRFKEQRAKFYTCEVLLALEDLHKRDIIFRDLKPDNVVLDKDGHCKLTDFGLSKEGVGENFFAKSFCGSIAYLAPEMLKKQGHGKAVDWYLLGVLFYEMLVGMTPYFTTRKEDIFYNIEFGELKIPNFIPKEAGELLKRLLERNPAKRLGGGKRDALEIKEHPYFKDVDWKKMYEKKIKPPNFIDYMNKTIKYYHKPKLFANDEFLNKTDDDKSRSNILKEWSFINKDEIV